MIRGCLCGDDDPDGCMYLNFGYPYCRPCEEHHRAPECSIDEHGQPDSWWTRGECGEDGQPGGYPRVVEAADDEHRRSTRLFSRTPDYRPSPAQKAREAEYAAQLAQVQASTWRVGVVDGSWRVHAERLQVFDDIREALERKRLTSWINEVLGVRDTFLWRDHEAAQHGREAFKVDVRG